MREAAGPGGGRLAVMLGSGLGGVCGGWPVTGEVPFDDIPGLGVGHVAGHAGVVRTCTVSERTGLFIMGRKHRYEGSARAIRALIDYVASRGVANLLLTSAAGSLSRAIGPGALCLADDILDMQFRPPDTPRRDSTSAPGTSGKAASTGQVNRLHGERPVEQHRAGLDRNLGRQVRRAADAAGIALSRGTLASMMGPTYETAAEVAMLQFAGAHCVTMSAAPEIEYAASAGMAVAALAVITNYATSISSERLSHEEVLRAGDAAAGGIRALIEQLILY